MHGIGSTLLISGFVWSTFGGVALAHDDAHGAPARGAVAKVVQRPYGVAGDARKASRTIDVVMTDEMRFTPAAITVDEGETIRFRVRNAGKTLHEMVLGTLAELGEHAAMMMRSADMAHGDANIVHVQPGTTGEMTWTFNRPGEVSYACLVAGHFEAGMVGTVVVKAHG